MYKEYLRVKIRSLAEEAKIIRHEERKFKKHNDIRAGLQSHRRCEVRNEARASLLAYAFIRNVPYEAVEAKCKVEPNWNRVSQLAKKYSPKTFVMDDFLKWKPKAETTFNRVINRFFKKS